MGDRRSSDGNNGDGWWRNCRLPNRRRRRRQRRPTAAPAAAPPSPPVIAPASSAKAACVKAQSNAALETARRVRNMLRSPFLHEAMLFTRPILNGGWPGEFLSSSAPGLIGPERGPKRPRESVATFHRNSRARWREGAFREAKPPPSPPVRPRARAGPNRAQLPGFAGDNANFRAFCHRDRGLRPAYRLYVNLHNFNVLVAQAQAFLQASICVTAANKSSASSVVLG